MNLFMFAAAFTAAIGVVLAAIDQLSDSTNIDLPIYLIVLFLALTFGYLGHIFGKITAVP